MSKLEELSEEVVEEQTFWTTLQGSEVVGDVTQAAKIPGGVLLRTVLYAVDNDFPSEAVAMMFLKGYDLFVQDGYGQVVQG